MPDLDLRKTFIQERKYVKNVSPRTVIWYGTAFSHFGECGLEQPHKISPAELTARLKTQLIALSQAGKHKPISINSWVRVINAYLRWLHTEEYIPKRITLPRLKEPETVIRPWSADQVHTLVSYKPVKAWEKRVHTLALLIADTGLRISEALNLDRTDVDLDQSLIVVRCGKGGKFRAVPISQACRKLLSRWLASHSYDPVFVTAGGTRLEQRNSSRALSLLCSRLKITGARTSWHTLRHSFALHYISSGGDVFSLQRILGHSTLDMTRRYVTLDTTALQAKHAQHARLLAGVR